MEEPVAAEEKHRSAMKMRVTVGAEAAPMCLKRSAPPEAVKDAPSLDPWLKADSGGRTATYGPGDGAAREISILGRSIKTVFAS